MMYCCDETGKKRRVVRACMVSEHVYIYTPCHMHDQGITVTKSKINQALKQIV